MGAAVPVQARVVRIPISAIAWNALSYQIGPGAERWVRSSWRTAIPVCENREGVPAGEKKKAGAEARRLPGCE